MKLNFFFAALCTSTTAVLASTSPTCDELTKYQAPLNQAAIRLRDFDAKTLRDIESKILSSGNTIYGDDALARQAHEQAISTSLQKVKDELKKIDYDAPEEDRKSIDNHISTIDRILKTEHHPDQGPDSKPSEYDPATLTQLHENVSLWREFAERLSDILAKEIEDGCSSGSSLAKRGLLDGLLGATGGDLLSSLVGLVVSLASGGLASILGPDGLLASLRPLGM